MISVHVFGSCELAMKTWTSPDRSSLLGLFAQHTRHQSMVLPWLTEGYGEVKVDSLENPKVAWLLFSRLSFVAGDVKSEAALNLVRDFPPNCLLVLPDGEWTHLVENEWGSKMRHQSRWRLSSSSLNIEHIRELKTHVPPEFTLMPIDMDALLHSDNEFWESIMLFFGSYKSFLEKGFGWCIKHGRIVVSVAYTAFPFGDTFEIQVMTTRQDGYRRKGLATAVSAALIEDGLSRGLVGEWDAANEISVKLAQKLGYTDPDPYKGYFWLQL